MAGTGKVKITMDGGDLHLSTMGKIVRTSEPAGKVEDPDARVRKQRPWREDLAVGESYVYEYSVGNGAGTYTLFASFADSDVVAASSGPRDAMFSDGNRFEFTVARLPPELAGGDS